MWGDASTCFHRRTPYNSSSSLKVWKSLSSSYRGWWVFGVCVLSANWLLCVFLIKIFQLTNSLKSAEKNLHHFHKHWDNACFYIHIQCIYIYYLHFKKNTHNVCKGPENTLIGGRDSYIRECLHWWIHFTLLEQILLYNLLCNKFRLTSIHL